MKIKNNYVLDVKDYKILFELERDATQTLNEIAKKVRLRKETVFYRIKNLERQNIIRSYLTEIDVYKLGYQFYPILLKFGNTKPSIEKEIIEHLKKNQMVAWLTKCEGYWDINLTILAKTNLEFGVFYDNFFKKYGGFIAERQFFITQEIQYFKKNFGLVKQGVAVVGILSNQEIKIEKEDRQILSLISNHARLPLVKIAEKLNLNPMTISYRLKKLRKLGLIQGARILTNFSKLGYKLYKIWFGLKDLNGQKWEEFINYCGQSGKIIWVTKIIGYYDLSIEIEVKDQEEFHLILEDIKERFSENITKHESLQIFSEEIMNYLPPVSITGS